MKGGPGHVCLLSLCVGLCLRLDDCLGLGKGLRVHMSIGQSLCVRVCRKVPLAMSLRLRLCEGLSLGLHGCGLPSSCQGTCEASIAGIRAAG